MMDAINVETIGNRAYKEIEKRAEENGTSPSFEAVKLGMHNSLLFRWKKNGNPAGYYLQQMYYAGYDVIYILTGEREHGK